MWGSKIGELTDSCLNLPCMVLALTLLLENHPIYGQAVFGNSGDVASHHFIDSISKGLFRGPFTTWLAQGLSP
jgi:hypothetical protein